MSDVLTYEQECKIRNDKITNGYIRTQIVTEHTIPTAIIDLCLKYYHILPEAFDINKTHKDIEISNDKLTASKKIDDEFYPNTYGTTGIDSNKGGRYQWRIKVERELISGDIMVGIGTNPSKNETYRNIDYAYQTHGGKTWKSGSATSVNYAGVAIDPGKELIIDVDFKSKQISYIADEENQGVIFKDIVIGPIYYFAVALNSAAITIKEFKCVE